jgi:Kef-type K+ transport system membrane component KefB
MNALHFGSSGVLILLGTGVFGGILGAIVFKRISAPQVLGYMATGIILGRSGLHLIGPADIEKLAPVNLFCLAVIGFLVGGEIKFETLKKYGKQFASILLGEGLAAFFLVTCAVTGIVYLVSGNFTISIAAGIVFGAIASATDPASTIAVLWEERSAGILTTTLIAIVALDDALAMTLYGLGSGMAQLFGQGQAHIGAELLHIGFELFGSLALGLVVGLIIATILIRSSSLDTVTASTVGLLMVTTGIADSCSMDVILASMAAGITVANRIPDLYENLSGRIKAFSTIIYVLFFIFVGARFSLQAMPLWLWAIVGAYVIGRSVGKMAGAWFGSRLSGAEEKVSRYTGLGLLAQGGVAVGLSIMAADKLEGITIAGGLSLGDVIISGITTTTFIAQIIGPALVKVAIKKGGERNRNIVADDIAASLHVSDVPLLTQFKANVSTPVREVLAQFSQGSTDIVPVVNHHDIVTGIIGLKELRDLMFKDITWDWLIAEDITSRPKVLIHSDQTLQDVLSTMGKYDVSHIPVVDEKGRLMGIASRPVIRDTIRNSLLKKELDHIH